MRPFNNLKNKIPSDTLQSSASRYESSGLQFFRTTKLNRGDIADLPLLRTLLPIRQKLKEPSFRKVIDSLFH